MVVVDASALAAVLFAEPAGPAVLERLGDRELHAPGILFFELTSVARTKARQRPAQTPAFADCLADGLTYPMSIDDVDFVEVMSLALRAELSAYDASYLWLALKLDAPLVTLDAKLAAHARTR